MGRVVAAEHVRTGKIVALKLLKSITADGRARFLREARAVSAVRHPRVVEVHDLFEVTDGVLVMVMTLLEGESLGARLSRDRTLPIAEVIAVLTQVVEALSAVHAVGLVHRDLKPDNIFLCRSSSPPDVKVLDFGVAKLTAHAGSAAHSRSLTETGAILGTPYYMSPEQVFAERDIDGRSDIWALGVILYECLSGLRPTQGENVGQVLKQITTRRLVPLKEVMPEIPQSLSDLVMSMLSREREDRPPSCDVLRERLASFLDERASLRVSAEEVDPLGATMVGSPITQGEAASTNEGTSRALAATRSRRRLGLTVAIGLAGATAAAFAASRLGAPPSVSTASPSADVALSSVANVTEDAAAPLASAPAPLISASVYPPPSVVAIATRPTPNPIVRPARPTTGANTPAPAASSATPPTRTSSPPSSSSTTPAVVRDFNAQ